MNALSNLKNLPFSKVEQADFTNQAIAEILEGNIDPLAADIRLKAMENVIKSIRDDKRVKDYVIESASKFGKTFIVSGAEITITSRTTKDYTGCGDQVYNDMVVQLEALKAQIKAREAMLSTGVNPETGETYGPPKTSTTEFLTYRFK